MPDICDVFEMISKSYDISDKRFIDPVVDYIRGKDNE